MTSAAVLLPSDPLDEREPDGAFMREGAAARDLNARVSLVDHDRLERDGDAAFRRLPDAGSTVYYRGWMMSADAYQHLDDALRARDLIPVTSASQYATAHHLVGWVDAFAQLTPATVFLPVTATPVEIVAAAHALGGAAFIVKDWVKSRKHEWETACFAPSAESLPPVVSEFIKLQEEFLVGDVAIRRFVDLDPTQPEVRIWWAYNEIALVVPHPDHSGRTVPTIDPQFIEQVQNAVRLLDCPFVTTDLALTTDGSWIVIEVGDGQVSGLPDSATEDDVSRLLSAVLGL